MLGDGIMCKKKNIRHKVKNGSKKVGLGIVISLSTAVLWAAQQDQSSVTEDVVVGSANKVSSTYQQKEMDATNTSSEVLSDFDASQPSPLHHAVPPIQLAEIQVLAQKTPSYAAQNVHIAGFLQQVQELAQSVTVLTQQQIEDQAFSSVYEMLEQATGVKPYGYQGSEVYTIRISSANAQVNGVTRFSQLSNEDPALYQQIEILKGPTGVLRGSGEAGGTINYQRKRPQPENSNGLAVSLGSWDSYRVELDLNAKLNQSGNWRGRMVGAFNQHGKFYDVAQHDEKISLYAITEYEMNERMSLGLSALHIDEKYVAFWGLPLDSQGQLPDREEYAGYNKYSDREQNELTFDLKFQINPEWLFKAAYYYRNVYDENWGAFGQDRMSVDGLANVMVAYIESDSTERGFDLQLTGHVNLLQRKHQISLGYNYAERDWYIGLTNDVTLQWDILNVHDYTTVLTNSVQNTMRIGVEQFGLYAMSKSKLNNVLTLTLGGRWNEVQQKNTFMDGTFPTLGTDSVHSEQAFTPYAGVVWNIKPDLSWYSSYAEIFFPQIEQDQLGNSLDARVGWQIESGVKSQFFDQALNASLAVFLLREENRAVLNTHYYGCGGSIVGLCYQAAGEIESRGYELELMGKLSKNLNLSVGYTYNDARYRQDLDASLIGKRFAADYIPKHLLRFWAQYRVEYGRWADALAGLHLGIGIQAQSDTYYDGGEYLNKQGGYTVVSAKLSYHINPHWQVAFHLNNVFDKTYLNYPGYAGYYNLYAEPRNFILSLRANF